MASPVDSLASTALDLGRKLRDAREEQMRLIQYIREVDDTKVMLAKQLIEAQKELAEARTEAGNSLARTVTNDKHSIDLAAQIATARADRERLDWLQRAL